MKRYQKIQLQIVALNNEEILTGSLEIFYEDDWVNVNGEEQSIE